MTIEIRDADMQDAEALIPLFAELGYPVTAGELRARLPAVQRAGDRVLVAAHDGTLAGFAVVHITPSLHRPAAVGRVTAIAVSPDAQGTGVGRDGLMHAAEEIVARAGSRRLEVTSGPTRAGAHAFYRRLGYAEMGIRFARDLTAPRETPGSPADGVRTP